MAGKFSIIIPVFNEAATINKTIAAVNNLENPENREIIVADGHPDQTTLCEINSANVIKISCPQGRGQQLNCGAAEARGEILLFLHADTRLPARALQQIMLALEDPAIVGGAFDLGIAADSLAFRLIEKAASWRSRFTRVPYGDQAIFIRADYFRQLGGFRHIPLLEDVELMQRIKRNKGRIKIIPERVATSPRRWEKDGLVLGTLRNRLLMGLYLLGVKPETLVRFYK